MCASVDDAALIRCDAARSTVGCLVFELRHPRTLHPLPCSPIHCRMSQKLGDGVSLQAIDPNSFPPICQVSDTHVAVVVRPPPSLLVRMGPQTLYIVDLSTCQIESITQTGVAIREYASRADTSDLIPPYSDVVETRVWRLRSCGFSTEWGAGEQSRSDGFHFASFGTLASLWRFSSFPTQEGAPRCQLVGSTLPLTHFAYFDIAYLPWGPSLVHGGYKTFEMFHARDLRLLREKIPHRSNLMSFSVNAEMRTLFASGDRTLTIWDGDALMSRRPLFRQSVTQGRSVRCIPDKRLYLIDRLEDGAKTNRVVEVFDERKLGSSAPIRTVPVNFRLGSSKYAGEGLLSVWGKGILSSIRVDDMKVVSEVEIIENFADQKEEAQRNIRGCVFVGLGSSCLGRDREVEERVDFIVEFLYSRMVVVHVRRGSEMSLLRLSGFEGFF